MSGETTASGQPPRTADQPGQRPRLNVRLRRENQRHLVVELIGEIDASVATDLEALGALIAASAPVEVDVDLHRVTFIDLGGLRALSFLADELRDRLIPVVELAASPAVDRLRALVAVLDSPGAMDTGC